MEKNHLFGQFMLNEGVVTQEQLNRAVDIQKSSTQSLGALGVASGMLNERDLNKILMRQWQKDQPFGRAAVAMKLLGKKDLEILLKKQSRLHVPLGEILVRHKIITKKKLESCLARFHDQKSSREDIFTLLKKVSLFSHLNVKELAVISLLLKSKTFKAGRLIYREGGKSEDLFLVESGMVRLSMKSGSSQMELGYLQKGDNFGLYSILNRSPRLERAEASSDTTLLSLSWRDLHDLLNNNPKLALAASRQLSDEVRNVVSNVKGESLVSSVYKTALIMDEALLFEQGLSVLPEMLRCVSGKFLVVTFSGDVSEKIPPEKVVARRIAGMQRLMKIQVSTNIQPDELVKLLAHATRNGRLYKVAVFLMDVALAGRLRHVIEICRRCVLVFRNEVPNFSNELRKDRDRLYLMSGGSSEQDLVRYRSLLAKYPEVLVPNLFVSQDTRTASQAAHWLLSRSVGVVFGGGGARGLAQIGVMEVLEEQGLVFDAVAGTSAGSITGSMVSSGLSAREIGELILGHFTHVRKHPLQDFRFSLKSVIRGVKFRNTMKVILGDMYCFETPVPFFSVCSDLNNGEAVILHDALLWEAVYISCSIPGYFPVRPYNGRLLADGGLVNNLPVSVLRDYGVDLVLSVNVSPDLRATPLVSTSMGAILGRSLDVLLKQASENRSGRADVEICPVTEAWGLFDFKDGVAMVESGREAALGKVSEIKRKLRELNRKTLD